MDPVLSSRNFANSDTARRLRRIPPPLLVIGGFLLLLAIIALVLFFRFKSAPPMNYAYTAPVTTAAVEVRTLPIFYETVGTLEASMKADIRPEASGVIRRLNFAEGQWVTKGKPLVWLNREKQSSSLMQEQAGIAQSQASLNSSQAEYQASVAAVESAEAQRNLASAEYNRYRNLRAQDFVSAQELDERRARFEQADAAYRAAQRQRDSAEARINQAQASVAAARAEYGYSRAVLGDTVIRAPFSGQVGIKQAELGDYVSPSEVIVTLVQANPLKITVGVPERYINQLSIGLPVELQTESSPGQTFYGKLIFIDPMVSMETRTVQVKAQIDNPGGKLQPGQYANVKVILGQKPSAMVIPEEALVPQGEKYFVYVKKHQPAKGKEKAKYVARFTPVTTGQRLPGWVEIISGLEPGDRVLTGGIQKVQDGMEVSEVVNKPKALNPGKIVRPGDEE